MKKTQYLLFMVAMLYALSPLWAQAAFDTVTTEGGSASIELTNDSSTYVIDASNRVESFTVNDSLTLVLSSTTAGGQAWREVARTVI